jgi:hypothetical protein
MPRKEASQGGYSEDGGSGGGSALGACGSGGSSASPHLWHGGSALGSFGAFMAATTGVPGGGTGSCDSVLSGPRARAMSFNAAIPTTYNGVTPSPFAAATSPAPFGGVPSIGTVAMAPTYVTIVTATVPFVVCP